MDLKDKIEDLVKKVKSDDDFADKKRKPVKKRCDKKCRENEA